MNKILILIGIKNKGFIKGSKNSWVSVYGLLTEVLKLFVSVTVTKFKNEKTSRF